MASTTPKTTTTTLMTFLVKTPPSTQSVNLFGSWDNFSQSYRMKRDTRVGAEHWTGCHTFENIICDGNVKLPSGTRQGGLKMGGTYWYYYQLDGDVDYHNPAEPSTTSCPMLPGQVVNVLNVPMHFSSGHHRSRNASVSSTSSDLRTMNPEDKYVNPRPAPKPALTCSNMSLPQASALNLECSTLSRPSTSELSSHQRNASLPASTTSLRSFRLPRKSSADRRGRSASPTRRPTGLKAALRQLAPPKASSPESKVVRGHAGFPATGREWSSSIRVRRSDSSVTDHFYTPAPHEGSAGSPETESLTLPIDQDARMVPVKTLALRQSIDEPETVEEPRSNLSFQNHRRQRSRSREPLRLQDSFTSREEPKEELPAREGNCQLFQPLETVAEVFSPQNPSLWPAAGTDGPEEELAGKDPASEVSDKRLPTLPNSALASHSEAGDMSKKLGDLQGNTSKVTVSDDCPSSTIQSHFSRWTGTTASSFASSQWSSVFFDGKSPSFTQSSEPSSQLTSPYGKASSAQSPDALKQREYASMLDANRMPSVISSSTISSYENTSPPSPASATSESIALKNEPTSLQKRYGMMLDGFQRYKFPFHDYTSEASITSHLPHRNDDQLHNTFSGNIGRSSPRKPTIDDFQPSANMQQLMAELSYLGDMIQK